VSRQGGFTLLEVLVAFAILSITIVVAVRASRRACGCSSSPVTISPPS
jgi:prepilin-type N-terminal cleavage/methylation domain-containing protein